MKVTKYPQSCLLLEKDGRRIVIDPGTFFTAAYKVSEFGDIEAVLYTHQHSDHFDESIIDELRTNGVKLFGNSAVVPLIGDGVTEVKDAEPFEVAGFQILPHDLPHCLLPDGSEGPMNTGYIINGCLFHPGDGVKTGLLHVENVALPIIGPDISILDAITFTKDIQAKKIIPIHYDAIKLSSDSFVEYFKRGGGTAEVIVLKDGESVEL